MNEEIIYHFISDFPIACSYQKLITDETKYPLNYEYIYVNKAYENLFQKDSTAFSKITLMDTTPFGSESLTEWIQLCVSMVNNNGFADKSFYNNALQKWVLATAIGIADEKFLILYSLVDEQPLNRIPLHAFFQATLDMMCISNLKGLFLNVNLVFEHVLGYSAEEIEGQFFLSFVHEDDIVSTSDALDTLSAQKPVPQYINRCRCKDGSYRYIEWNSTPYGEYVFSSGRDITTARNTHQALQHKNAELEKLASTLKESNTRLTSLAVTDQLTGLNNRHCFDEKIVYEMDRSDRDNTQLSMFIFDVDHFKSVNDDFGHPVGDSVLIHLANILKTHVRKTDMAFRIGGEEFVLLLPNTTQEKARKLAEKIRLSFESTLHPVAGKVTASFGVAERYKSETFKRWYKRTDNALYTAKNNGRNQVVSYNRATLPIARVQIEWNPEWNSGNPIIDAQHMELLELASGIFDSSYANVSPQNILIQIEDLIFHVQEHFKQEETLLMALEYDAYKEHKLNHASLLKSVLYLKSKYINGEVKSTDFFSFILDDFIKNHLLIEDLKYFTLTRS